MTMLVCYDISDDRARARTAATLQQWGDRIQRSVFVCLLSPDDLIQVESRLADIIDPDTDSVYFVPACAACWTAVHVLGQADTDPPTLFWAAL
ncbi:MAG TPA: CRISPR-associated endonuclease Cas2 [Mycobacteriales bacterium]|nr:CRISPR-associated endonuclease Cas2 [Mycobacteriales bacterium]